MESWGLKNCPMCGSEPTLGYGGYFYWVKCPKCGLVTEIVATKSEAFGLWNARVEDKGKTVSA